MTSGPGDQDNFFILYLHGLSLQTCDTQFCVLTLPIAVGQVIDHTELLAKF